ncbi:sensor domain-containing protein [Oceanobacter mangrovi]|uniref:sensor domain-containing protein n=1 Tax=Oceanobacter mangrovi TaxID=2862510 RepID=UPI001C8CFC23|nr:bifunctional diguanylate cyclase/phosphodiesterase [Oceanobacter mangrovi]
MGDLYQQIVELIDTGIILLDSEGQVISWNNWMERHSGILEAEIRGLNLCNYIPELKGTRIDKGIYKALQLNCPSVLSAKLLNVSFPLYKELITHTRRPERIVQSIQIKPFNLDDNSQYCVISVFDISSADMREKALRTQSVVLTQLVANLQEKEHELSTLFENTQNGILIFDRSGLIHSANRAARQMYLVDASASLQGKNLFELFDDYNGGHFGKHKSDEQIRALMPVSGEEREMTSLRSDGRRFPVSVSANSIPINEKETRFFMFVRDITEKKRAEEQLNRMARVDGLTGLSNRFSFTEILASTIRSHSRDDHSLSVFFIDLDRFKGVNDNHGHDAGDELLRQVAERLRTCCRDSDTIARWAGDEFVILLPQQNQSRSSITVAEKILLAIAEPFDIFGKQVFINCSIGISQFPDDGNSAERLIFCADQAMYQAKSDGKGVFRFFTREMNERTLARLKTENELRIALEENQFELYFQPQVEVATGQMKGVEALIRWNHPQRGMVYPDEFIQVAEECGLIGQLGDWVIMQAFETASRWYKREGSPLTMSINISPKQFVDDGLVYTVRRLLNSVGFPPEQIVLEITETHLMAGEGHYLRLLNALKLLGIKIAIDDFGKGYSSLAYLRKLPVDIIKIDRYFLQGAASNNADAKIVSAIIDLAHALDLEVVAEGIEHLSQMELLRFKHCDHAQGYFIGKPMSIEDLVGWYGSIGNKPLVQ